MRFAPYVSVLVLGALSSTADAESVSSHANFSAEPAALGSFELRNGVRLFPDAAAADFEAVGGDGAPTVGLIGFSQNMADDAAFFAGLDLVVDGGEVGQVVAGGFKLRF